MRAHLDTLEALLACTTPDELRRAVGEYVKRLGFDSWVYAANPNGQNAFPYVLSAYPAAWLKRYVEKGYLGVDPVVAHCREHMAHFKVPKRVIFVGALPKNPSGKLLKRELRKQFAAAPAR